MEWEDPYDLAIASTKKNLGIKKVADFERQIKRAEIKLDPDKIVKKIDKPSFKLSEPEEKERVSERRARYEIV